MDSGDLDGTQRAQQFFRMRFPGLSWDDGWNLPAMGRRLNIHCSHCHQFKPSRFFGQNPGELLLSRGTASSKDIFCFGDRENRCVFISKSFVFTRRSRCTVFLKVSAVDGHPLSCSSQVDNHSSYYRGGRLLRYRNEPIGGWRVVEVAMVGVHLACRRVADNPLDDRYRPSMSSVGNIEPLYSFLPISPWHCRNGGWGIFRKCWKGLPWSSFQRIFRVVGDGQNMRMVRLAVLNRSLVCSTVLSAVSHWTS